MKIAKETTLFEGKRIRELYVKNLKNVVGEPTTVLFNRELFEGSLGILKEGLFCY